MFQRGDRVQVRGYGGTLAVLRVWEDKGRGLLLCSEGGYKTAIAGGELVAIGFPMSDIVGLASEAAEHRCPSATSAT